ncbi:MAG: ABC transporter permease subunit [Verrucomicrobia bacterium]|nr:ABC transporter permease subunit [Verrucomicrobiota bacterium]
MFKFVAQRLLQTLVVLFLVGTITFFMVVNAPGSPFDAERNMPPEIRANLMAYYGLDQPQHVQYWRFLTRLVLSGDFGPSYKYNNRTVTELIAESLPVSAELGLYAVLIAVGIGVSAGLIASLRPNSVTDYAPMSLAMMGISIPLFVSGPILLLVFGIWLQWFNVSGWNSPADKVLPAVTLGMYYAAYFARLTRGGMLEILSQDFVRTARAKGASELRVVFRHALRGGILPSVAYLGPALAGIISGSFVVETTFQVPGLGRYFVNAAFNRDYTMIMGTTILFATLISVFNLLVDLVLVWLNPRLKFES